MLKKIIVSAVIISLPVALAARGGHAMRPAPRNSGNISRPPVTIPASSIRPSVQRPSGKPQVVNPPGRPVAPKPQPKPPQPPKPPKPPKPPQPPRPPKPAPDRPGHRPPPPPAWKPDYYSSGYIPVIPAVFYGDVPSDYTYAWYNDRYVLYWRGWFWYKAAWVWGGQGAAPAPPNWRPK